MIDEAFGFGAYVKSVIKEAQNLAGVPGLAPLLGFLLLGAGARWRWIRRLIGKIPKRGEAAREFLERHDTGIRRALVISGILLLAVILVWASYRAARQYVSSELRARDERHNKVLAERERNLAATQQEITESRREVASLKHEIQALRDELTTARETMDRRAFFRSHRDTLASYLNRGQQLRMTCFIVNAEPPWTEAQKWEKEVDTYLHQRGEPSEVAQFRSPTTRSSMSYSGMSAPCNRLVNQMDPLLDVLTNLIRGARAER